MASVGLLLIAMVGVVRPAIASWRHHTTTATGTMAAYDPDTRVLTVSSASGSAARW